ncbi:hypothetical protein [Nakamurella flava]|uniref:phage major capsid protein n=1 Tax=Nakamurella flava TaxID=2576308 RepID=UPI00197C18BE|nr:hypothetical protein [Nakamurella flava]
MPITYPPPAATLSPDLTATQVHYLLKNPSLIARRVRDLALNRYVADYLLTGRYTAEGGAILYPNGEPVFADSDPEAVGVGGEYPLDTVGQGTLAMARTVKWGRDGEVYDEAIKRMLIDPVNRLLSRLINSNVRYVDSVALAVIASKITRTRAATGAWTSGAQIITDVLLAKADTEQLEDGFDLDTVVLTPVQYAKVVAALIKDGLLPREAANPVLSSGVIPDVLGLSWTRSAHSPTVNPLLVDREQLGGMADEDLQSPGYTSAGPTGIEAKVSRLQGSDDRDGYRIRVRRVTVPVVVEPNAGIQITGTGV